MIANKKKFYTGLTLMVLFTAVFIKFFLPLYDGMTGLEYLDNLYNSISKGSAYYIESTRDDVKAMEAANLTLNLAMKNEAQAAQTAIIFDKAGAMVAQDGANLTITGDIPTILNHCLDDTQLMYDNDGAAVNAKYDIAGKVALYNWWVALKAMDKDLKHQKQFAVAKAAEQVNKKAVEMAYNYYGIEGQKITERMGLVLFSLVFYVIYTLWYGFGIMYLFEGWGMRLEH